MGAHHPEQLRLKGGPTRLSASLRLPDSEVKARNLQVGLTGGITARVAIRPVTRHTPGIAVVKVRLPKNTPPGTYEGMVQLDGVEVPVVAHVEARPRLRFVPNKLLVKAPPGAVVHADVTVVNGGNVPVNIEAKQTFCIFDGSGIDRAFAAVLTDEKATGQERMGLLMDKLADFHGGFVRLIVDSGTGILQPNEDRDLHLSFRFSAKLQLGGIYDGVWDLGGGSYHIQIEVTDKQTQGEEYK